MLHTDAVLHTDDGLAEAKMPMQWVCRRISRFGESAGQTSVGYQWGRALKRRGASSIV